MFGDWLRRKPAPLTGAPAVRRIKTFSAQSGYVYQYEYQGQRPAAGGDPGIEFVFHLSADRKTWRPCSVFVLNEAVRAWEHAHARTLSVTEWYALAKMALFAAFDERETPAAMHTAPVWVRASDVDGIMESLDLT
jgi:hypothetical protein